MKKRFAYIAAAMMLGTTMTAGTMGTACAVYAEDSLKTVGEETQDAKSVKVKNTTGKAIKGVEFFSESDDAFGSNLLKDGDTFEADEQRVLYYVPVEDAEESGYVIRITFGDDSTVTLHEVKFSDMSEDGFSIGATGDGIGYVAYKSVSEGKDVDTKRVELAYLSYDDVSTGNGEDAEAGGMFEECMNDGLMD